MAVELGSAFISVGLGTNTLSKDIKKAFGGADSAGSAAGKSAGGGFMSGFKGLIGPGLALLGGGVFAGFIKEAAVASDATDKFKATMNFAGLNTKAIDVATKAAKDFADQTVYDLPTIQNTIAQLASNGVKDYTGLTKAAGNLNAVAGGNAETFKSVAMVMTQTAGAGKLTTENWNQMADAIPGAAGPLMKSLEQAGAFTGNFRDAMAAGEITADEFNAALMKLGTDPVAVEAAKSTATFEGALGGLEATINSGLTGALNALKPSITGTINLLSGGLGAAFKGIGGAITDFTAGFTKGVDAVGSNQSALAHWGAVAFGIVDTVRGGFTAMFGAFKAGDGDITSSGFAGFMELVGGTARQLYDTLAPAISALLPQVVSLWSAFSPLQVVFKAIQPLLPQLAAVFTQLVRVIGGGLSSALTSIVPALMQISALISQSLGSVLSAVLPAAVQMITMLGDTISNLLPVIMPIIATIVELAGTLISQLAPIITNLVTAILPPVIDIFGNIIAAIGPLISMIASLLIPIVQALMPVVVTVFGVIANVITSVMQIVQGVIQVVTGLISGNWDQVWTGIQNIFGGIWNTIVALVSGAIQIVWSVITNGLGLIWGVVSSVLGSIGQFFIDTWNNVVNGVSSMIGQVGGFFSGLWDTITGALAGAGKWLFDAGVNIVNGLFDGIKSLAGTIGSFFLSLLPGWIVEPFKLALGIHSPSRVFAGLGKNIGQGLLDGVDGMQGKIDGTMSNLVTVPPVPSFGSSRFTPAAAGAGAGGPAVQMTVNASDGMDAVTVGKIAGNTVNNELRRSV